MKILISEFTAAMDGGADIISYEIQIDDGLNGPFRTVLGGDGYTLDTQILVTSDIIKGRQYRLRYRAINVIGSGPWSDLKYVIASTYPKAPPQPQYVFVDNTRVDLILSETQDDGGSNILAYHLFINEGSDGSPYHEVTTYDGSSLAFSVNVGEIFTGMTVTAALTYTFKF